MRKEKNWTLNIVPYYKMAAFIMALASSQNNKYMFKNKTLYDSNYCSPYNSHREIHNIQLIKLSRLQSMQRIERGIKNINKQMDKLNDKLDDLKKEMENITNTSTNQ